MPRHPAPRPHALMARAAGFLLLATLLVGGCDLWPFGDPGEPAPQRTLPALPTTLPGLPSPTILVPPPID